MMKLRINPLVVADLKEIRRFIAEDNREKTECGHLLSVLIRKTEGIGKIASHFFCFFAIIYADLRPPAEGRREIKKQEKDEKNLCFDYSGI